MSVRKHACWDLGEVKGGTGTNGLRSKGCRLPGPHPELMYLKDI